MKLFGIFAKHWTPGSVKTRLAASIGAAQAANLYRSFLDTLLSRFAGIGDHRILAFSPDERQADFDAIADDGWETVPQAAGDLGDRMTAFFEYAFSSGFERTVLIGSDSPTLPAAHLEQAFQALSDHDVVLGPSEDGGYYLIGAEGGVPPIFRNVDWSTENVWAQTIQQLKSHNIPFAILPPWYDVDEYRDLIRLQAELGSCHDGGVQNSRLQLAVNAALSDATNTDLRM